MLCLCHKSNCGLRNWYLLASRYCFSIAEAFALQLLGVRSLHSLHIVHRDLKPDNVLISPNGHLAIADFGFAKSFSSKHWTDARMTEPLGTAGYLAPEILDHHLPTTGYSSAVDVWGYGMILLEMLLGKVRCCCFCF